MLNDSYDSHPLPVLNYPLKALIEEIRAADKVRDETVKKVVQTAQQDKERALKKINNKSKK